MSHFRRALEIEPDSAETLVNLGGAHRTSGNYREAVVHLRDALRLEPKRIPILSNLAWILATCPDSRIRDGQEAVRLAELAAQLSGRNDFLILDILAASYAEAGLFKKAVESAKQGLTLARKQSDLEAAARFSSRIDLYRSHTAYRETR